MHYYQHHIGDFIKATARLSDAQCMAYLRLVWMYYDKEAPLKAEPKLLAFHIGAPEDDVSLILQSFFVEQEDGWHHLKCDQDIAEYRAYVDKKSNAGRASAERRKNNSSTPVEQVLDDSSAVVQPNHKPLTTNQEPDNQVGKEDAPKVRRLAPPEDVSDEVWSAYLAVRRAKRAPITELAMKANRREAAAAGLTLQQALTFCCEANWQAFNAQWWKDRTSKTVVGKQSALEARNAEVVRRLMQGDL